MEQKATNKLIGFERHHFRLVVVTIALLTEADMSILTDEQPTVDDRDSMVKQWQWFSGDSGLQRNWSHRYPVR